MKLGDIFRMYGAEWRVIAIVNGRIRAQKLGSMTHFLMLPA